MHYDVSYPDDVFEFEIMAKMLRHRRTASFVFPTRSKTSWFIRHEVTNATRSGTSPSLTSNDHNANGSGSVTNESGNGNVISRTSGLGHV